MVWEAKNVHGKQNTGVRGEMKKHEMVDRAEMGQLGVPWESQEGHHGEGREGAVAGR